MVQNHIKIAWRNLKANKFFTFLNILGLSIGMALAMLLGIWIHNEISFNKGFENYDRIAQVMQHNTQNGEIVTQSWNPYPLAEEIRNNYPDDFEYVVQSTSTRNTITFGEKKVVSMGSFFEPEIMDILSLQLTKGDQKGLYTTYSVFISQSLAYKIFGDADPIHKTLSFGDFDVEVKGVFDDLPQNSTFGKFEFILPWELYMATETWIQEVSDPWRPNFAITYALIREHGDFAAISSKIKDVKLRNVDEVRAKSKPEVFLYPMEKWHLYENFENGINTGGSIQYVWLFGIIALFVLILACINFMNLSTARSEKRSKEVGIRKAIGSVRNQILSQFYTESFLMTFLALAVAFVWIMVFLPLFNEVANAELSLQWENPIFWLLSIGFCIFTGLFAGSYPAIYLSSFQPVKVLKGTFKTSKNAIISRKSLVVFQFTVSIAIVIGTIIVYQQIEYAKNRDLGYDKENLMNVFMNPNSFANYEAFANEAKAAGLVSSLAYANGSSAEHWSTTTGLSWSGKDIDLSVDIPVKGVSPSYGETIGWEILKGRDFRPNSWADTSAIVINEAMAKLIGKEDPLGMEIKWDEESFQVIGVSQNRVVGSAFENSRPEVTILSNYFQPMMLIKLAKTEDISGTVASLKEIFLNLNPDSEFQYDFTDEIFAAQFKETERIGKLASIFAILTILISCLGLFGLASFMAQQRTKEIGVRKVMGASVFSICALLSKEFIILIGISLIIAIPLSSLYMNSWLENYTYRMEVGFWVFGIAALGAVLITLLTVSYQALRAALLNPVTSLKSD